MKLWHKEGNYGMGVRPESKYKWLVHVLVASAHT